LLTDKGHAMSKFQVGDKVTVMSDGADVKVGTPYVVVHVAKDCLTIIDDACDEQDFCFDEVTIHTIKWVPKKGALATGHAPDYTAAVLKEYTTHGSDDEPTYDEQKAAAPVCSKGLFNKGDVLVYRDRTPTLTTLTVSWCTATAVCFEETYSMPFNPNEFIAASEAQYD
jgi:hypothetical protein